MKKGVLIGVIALVVILAVIGYFMFKPAPIVDKAQGSGEEGAAVTIKNYNFNPTTVNIQVNQTVVWRNQDNVTHDVTIDSGLFSEDIGPGEEFSYQFTEAGTYDYHCDIHTSMKGRVVVA
jgi:plastocyanin